MNYEFLNNNMRKKIVAANWKMNLTLGEGSNLVNELISGAPAVSADRIVVIATPFVHLTQTAAQLEGVGHIHVGAQNCSSEKSGAYTGEVSAAMLNDAGVQYVIIGHSERRGYFNEDSAVLAKKVNQGLDNELQVIFCCGEPLEIRDGNGQNQYVAQQIEEGLFHLTADQLKNVTIAYEPIWAIGTGRTATSAQAQEIHASIRNLIADQYGADAASNLSILYGGSCNPANAAELFACADVDGGLIGGASLKADQFLSIITAMVQA